MTGTTSRFHPRHAWVWATEHPVLATFLISYIAHAAVALVETFLLGNALDSADSIGYQQMLVQAATGQTSSWDPFTRQLYGANGTFTVPLTLLYRVVGTTELYGQLFVGVAGAAVAALTAWIASEVMAKRWALAAGLLVGLFPSQVFFSSSVLKDPFVWLSAVAIGAALVVASKKEGLGDIAFGCLLVALPLAALAYSRIHSFVVAVLALAIAAWFGSEIDRIKRGASLLAVAILVPWITGLGPLGWEFLTETKDLAGMRMLNAVDAASAFIPTTTEQDELAAQATEYFDESNALFAAAAELEAKAAAGEKSPAGEDPEALATEAKRLRARARELEEKSEQLKAQASAPSTATDALKEPALSYLPRGLVVVLLRPFPWESGTLQLQLAAVETVFWYPLLALAALGLPRAFRSLRALAFPMLYGGGVLLVYALAEGNLGSVFRHRAEFVWVLALLAALGAQTVSAFIRRRKGEPA